MGLLLFVLPFVGWHTRLCDVQFIPTTVYGPPCDREERALVPATLTRLFDEPPHFKFSSGVGERLFRFPASFSHDRPRQAKIAVIAGAVSLEPYLRQHVVKQLH